MSDFEQGLANIMGSFMEINLDCVEKQNQEIERLQQENKQLKEVIEEVREEIEDYQEYIDEAKEFYSDLEDDDVVKVSNLQLLNNQMVRNYDLLEILDKAKGSE